MEIVDGLRTLSLIFFNFSTHTHLLKSHKLNSRKTKEKTKARVFLLAALVGASSSFLSFPLIGARTKAKRRFLEVGMHFYGRKAQKDYQRKSFTFWGRMVGQGRPLLDMQLMKKEGADSLCSSLVLSLFGV